MTLTAFLKRTFRTTNFVIFTLLYFMNSTALLSQSAELMTSNASENNITTIQEGDTVSFILKVHNDGPDIATNVSLINLLPAGLTPITGNGVVSQGTYNDSIWQIGTLAIQASVTMTLKGTVDIGQGGQTITSTTTAAFSPDVTDPNHFADQLSASVFIVDPCNAGASGLPDLDNDNVADRCDLDDDNDGIPNTVEDNCGTTTQLFFGPTTQATAGRITGDLTNGPQLYTGFVASDGSPYNVEITVTIENSSITPGNGITSYKNYDGQHSVSIAGERVLVKFISAITGKPFAINGFDFKISDMEYVSPYLELIPLFRYRTADGTDVRYENGNWEGWEGANGIAFGEVGSNLSIDGAGALISDYPGQSADQSNKYARLNIPDIYLTEVEVVQHNSSGGGAFGWRNNPLNVICDADRDGIANSRDLDADNDGITDLVENAGGQTSLDLGMGDLSLDGKIGNFTDSADQNGWNDASTSTVLDSDGDLIPDYLDLDADNDGIPDYKEGVCSTCPSFALNPVVNNDDLDQDGILDIYEQLTASNDNGGANAGVHPNVDDNSGNSVPDYLDLNTDNDAAYDWTEGYDTNNNGQVIEELRNTANSYESANSRGHYLNSDDMDNDGIPDWLDNLPNDIGYDETQRPPFLQANGAYWFDLNQNGLVDLFDVAQDGVTAPTPDHGGSDLDWRDASASAILPVELIYFVAKPIACSVELAWEASAEEKFRHYEIQRSEDGFAFTTLAIQLPQANRHGASYQYRDEQANELNYYRLKMVDLDGSIEYSDLIYQKINCVADADLIVFPNPVSQYQEVLTVKFKTFTSEEHLSITDMLGREVKRIVLEVAPETEHTVHLDISDLQKGAYYLHQQVKNIMVSTLFVVQE